MRITEQQAQTIKRTAQAVFGEGSRTYLFGSRTRDEAKGGDIDLYVQPTRTDSLFQRKRRMASRLQMALGDQRFDIVIAQDPGRLIEKEALDKAIRL